MPTDQKAPVASFGAELLQALQKGAEKEYRITFESETLAKRFQHRINHFRSAMKREKRAEAAELYRCGIHQDPLDKKTLILAPRDSEFRKALRSALGSDSLSPLPSVSVDVATPEPGDDPASSFLGELTEATKVPPAPKNPDEPKD